MPSCRSAQRRASQAPFKSSCRAPGKEHRQPSNQSDSSNTVHCNLPLLVSASDYRSEWQEARRSCNGSRKLPASFSNCFPRCHRRPWRRPHCHDEEFGAPFGRSSRSLAQGLSSKASPAKSLSAPPQREARPARFLALSARAIIVTDSAFSRGKYRGELQHGTDHSFLVFRSRYAVRLVMASTRSFSVEML